MINQLPYKFSIVYIDDGSTDKTLGELTDIAKLDDRITVIELSRNFGHQAALTAGLDNSDGDIVITLDGDGQHPPKLIPELLKYYSEGYDIVQTQRINDNQITFIKKLSSKLFYWLINLFIVGAPGTEIVEIPIGESEEESVLLQDSGISIFGKKPGDGRIVLGLIGIGLVFISLVIMSLLIRRG